MQHIVQVLNDQGVWVTDTTTTAQQAQDRAKFLVPRVPAVRINDAYGRKVPLEGA